MKKDYLSSFIDDEYNIPEIALKTIFLSPIIMSFFFFLLITFSFTRRFGFWLLDENKPVEILTFLMFFIGGIYGFYKTYRLKQILKFKFSFFYVMFSFFLILIAMEEISWGQWFLHFNTPINWEKINMQGETTLHNLKGMQGNSELLRILFGIGGLLGILLRNKFNFKFIGAPKVLMTWFLIIIVQSVVDTFTDMNNIHINIDYAIQRISEFIEMLIALSALIYLWMNFKFLTSFQQS